MASLLFLFAALVLSGLGTAIVVIRAREPRGLDHGVRNFQREMRALAPESSRVVRVPPEPRAGTRRASRG